MISASRETLLITGRIQAPVRISQLKVVYHLVMERLVTPVILSLNFYSKHILLNIASKQVTITNPMQLVVLRSVVQ